MFRFYGVTSKRTFHQGKVKVYKQNRNLVVNSIKNNFPNLILTPQFSISQLRLF